MSLLHSNFLYFRGCTETCEPCMDTLVTKNLIILSQVAMTFISSMSKGQKVKLLDSGPTSGQKALLYFHQAQVTFWPLWLSMQPYI